MAEAVTTWDLLRGLLAIDSPSGDEGPLADWLWAYCESRWPDSARERLRDTVLVARGPAPQVAVFAHIDTTGFTLGYGNRLIPLGGPAPKRREPLRPAGGMETGHRLKRRENGDWVLKNGQDAAPGTRWVYASPPLFEGTEITAPYLDNRAGVWAALQVLERCPSVAVAFTAGEEHSGQGAFVAAHRLFEKYGIAQALIADITWDTDDVHCGQGVAISLRDRMVPRQRFLDRVLRLAETSGVPFQREIETSGGSDGASIERSGVPMDWVFVGAPEKKPHTSSERLDTRDLEAMADMLVYLVDRLDHDSSESYA